MPVREGRANQDGFHLNDLPSTWLQSLVQEQLTAQDRLSLFRVSKGTSAAVLQHAPGITLSLLHRHDSNITTREEYQTRHAIETIIAAAPGAEIKAIVYCIRGCLPFAWISSIRQQVTHLTLWDLFMTEGVLELELQLQLCNKLQMLVLKDSCRGNWSLQQLESLAQQRTGIVPPTLTHLQTQTSGTAIVADMLRLVGPQLTHFTYFNEDYEYPLDTLSQVAVTLTQLTHFRVTELDSWVMDSLLLLPSLTHVTAQDVSPYNDYSNKQVGWQQLEITARYSMVDLSSLALLPLHHIKRLVIHAGIRCGWVDVQQRVAHLATCTSLQCVPWVRHPTLHPEHPKELITLCANSMTGSGGLFLQSITFPELQEALPATAQLPPTIHSLRLKFLEGFGSSAMWYSTEQRVQVLLSLLRALPQHIKQLIINHTNDIMAIAQAILSHLQASQQAIKLVIAVNSWTRTEDSAQLRALAEAHPEHMGCVHLENEP